MATIAALETLGDLVPYDPDFEADEFPGRWIHQAPAFAHWMANTLPTETSDEQRNLSPFEQVEQRLYEYSLGRPMVYDRDRKLLDPVGFHVWELKTVDVRIFGWFPARRHFIAVCGEMRRRLKPASQYTPFVQSVVAFRNGLNLDLPKFLTGVRTDDIC